MKALTKKRKKVKSKNDQFECRFPGCDQPPYGRTQDRGRHEALAHGMKGGIVPALKITHEPPAPPPPATVKLPESFEAPRAHLERSIEQLNVREREISTEIEHLEVLRREAEEIGRQKDILSEALEKLVKNESQPAAHSHAHSD